jgi:hypothetical protein
LIRSQSAAKHFCDVAKSNEMVDAELLVHRRMIHGNHPNQDTEIVAPGDPTRTTLNLRPLLSYSPWLIVPAALTWLFLRRVRIKRAKAGGV